MDIWGSGSARRKSETSSNSALPFGEGRKIELVIPFLQQLLSHGAHLHTDELSIYKRVVNVHHHTVKHKDGFKVFSFFWVCS